MPTQIPMTKGNLLRLKHSYDLAKNGYDLMDRKRNILIKEMMEMVEKVKVLRKEITEAYHLGYYLLQQANMSSGIIQSIAEQITLEEDVELTYRSVMGVEMKTGKFLMVFKILLRVLMKRIYSFKKSKN